jgi:hypothetical protein
MTSKNIDTNLKITKEKIDNSLHGNISKKEFMNSLFFFWYVKSIFNIN